MDIYCYHYNNYYNRIIKTEDLPQPIYIEQDVNFNFSDGVNTQQVLNTELSPDYIVLIDDNGNINSKWFVIDAEYTLNGQHIFTLRRDVIVDNYEQIVSAPVFIEKATLNEDDPFIFNKEDMTYNQIKQSEIELKDETGSAWIVGYLQANYGDVENPPEEITIVADAIADYNAASVQEFETDFGWHQNTIAKKLSTRELVLYFKHHYNAAIYDDIIRYAIIYNLDSRTWRLDKQYRSESVEADQKNYIDLIARYSTPEEILNIFIDEFNTTIIDRNETICINDIESYNNSRYNKILSNSGKIVEITTGTSQGFNKIEISNEANISKYYSTRNILELNRAIPLFLTSRGFDVLIKYDDLTLRGAITYRRIFNTARYNLVSIPYGTLKVTLGGISQRLHLKNAPFDMFCIPYKDNLTIVNSKVSGFQSISMNKGIAMNIAQGIAKGLGNFLIDLQLLPYCPMTGFNISGDTIDINSNSIKRYNLVKDDSQAQTVKGIVLWSTASSGTKNIQISIPVDEPKIQNECDMWRLVSPNYNGTFEFNVAKNGGLSNINIDYTYLPYQPYIHVNPTFSKLYGQDFNDSRGLICGGDFSISYLSDAWINYQINNKNYQNMFDRQIENMEINQRYQRIGDVAGAITGTVAGAAEGWMLGIGNPIGAVIGGAASAAGGVTDVVMKEKLRTEAIDYAKDNFGYQLGNIQALPYSLAKNTSFNENNKIFPILEYYTCTDEEKDALRNKLKYNGMTVMRIGTIAEFLKSEKTYIKGKLIRIEGLEDDFHMINAISEELNKGVFI